MVACLSLPGRDLGSPSTRHSGHWEGLWEGAGGRLESQSLGGGSCRGGVASEVAEQRVQQQQDPVEERMLALSKRELEPGCR